MNPTTYSLLGIPSGKAGVVATLKLMRSIVRQYKKNPTIRELALRQVRRLPDKNFTAEANALFKFVRDNIRYVKDINGVETIHTPIELLKRGQGDCDDQSILLASLLESIGHPTAFEAIGFAPQTFSHVFVKSRVGNKWVSMDPIMTNWPMGKSAPNVVTRYTIRN